MKSLLPPESVAVHNRCAPESLFSHQLECYLVPPLDEWFKNCSDLPVTTPGFTTHDTASAAALTPHSPQPQPYSRNLSHSEQRGVAGESAAARGLTIKYSPRRWPTLSSKRERQKYKHGAIGKAVLGLRSISALMIYATNRHRGTESPGTQSLRASRRKGCVARPMETSVPSRERPCPLCTSN